MKPEALVMIYGEGGHKAQMERLLSRMLKTGRCRGIEMVGLCENNHCINGLCNFSLLPIRDKHSRVLTICRIPRAIWLYVRHLSAICMRYHVKGVISTGPGIAIIPSLFFRILGARIIFIETWSRFDTRSWSGRVMSRIANRFYVQNGQQHARYPGSIYGGLL